MSKRDLFLLIASAALITLAYPPFHLLVPSLVCLVPAVLLIEESNTARLPIRNQLMLGYGFGVLSNAVLLYWMVVALWSYSPLSVFAYAGTLALLGAYSAVMFALTGWVRRATGLSQLLVFPFLWTAQEWVVAHQYDLQFPWLGLGTSLTGFPTLVQVAEVIGARGVTFLLALANATLALAWIKRHRKAFASKLVVAVVAGVIAAWAYGLIRESGITVRSLAPVALLQPNVGHADKWNPALQDSMISAMVEASLDAQDEVSSELIVWPEAAVPGDLLRRADWGAQISALANSTSTPMVIGALNSQSLTESTSARFNAAFFVDSTGRIDGDLVYRKRYLVPVTERVPFLPNGFVDFRWFGSFEKGVGGGLYDSGSGLFGILICYESAFEDLAREYRGSGADFLVNITNDAWFDRTTAQPQHASHLVMRAIENRIGIARAANSGVTMFVDPLGRVYSRAETGVETVVTDVVKTSDALSIYSRLGDWVGGIVMTMTLFLLGYAWWREKQHV